jgi:hypothetical protein
MVAQVQAFVPVNANVTAPTMVNVGTPSIAGTSGVAQSVTGLATAEYGSDYIHTTVFTLTNLALTVRDTQQGGGVKIYQFPKGKIVRLGAGSDTTITTTSAIASTLKSGVTGNHGVGSTTQASATLATTEQDFVQVTNFTSSTTINVAPAAVKAYGVPSVTLLDGSSTAINLFFNVAVATGTDIDADASVVVNGTVIVHWIKV